VLTGVLGIQVSFAAMLRQSQIATGFLGAVFQVLGAILDSFLLAFAPQLFAIVEHLARLIPIARGIGEEVALQVGNLWEHIVTFTAWLKPILEGAWAILKGIFNWFRELAPIWKKTLLVLYVLPKLMAFFKVGFFFKTFKVLRTALAEHRLKTAATGGGAKGAGGLAMMIPHLRLAAITVAVIGLLFSLGFSKKDKGDGKGAGTTLDVTGQLGKSYQPSRASQLGGTLNEAYSAVIQPFTDSVMPELANATAEVGEIMSQTAINASETITSKYDAIGIKIDEYGEGVTGMDLMNGKIVGASGIIVEDFGKIAAASDLLLDEYNLTITGLDSYRAAYDENLAKDVEATKLHQEGIKTATEGWVGDITEATGLQVGGYGTLTTGTDAMAVKLAELTAAHETVTDAAGATLTKGASQAKNQFVDTTGIMMGSAGEMKEYYDQILSKGEMDKAMGSLSGTMTGLSDYIATLYNRDDELKEAAQRQKEAAIGFQTMTANVFANYEQDRQATRRMQEESRDANNFAGSGDFGKFFDYLANY
jgi:hypothetical protein